MKKRNNLLVLSLTLSALLLVGCTTDQQAAAEPAPVESTKIMELTENAQTTALVHTDVKDAEDFVPPVKEEAKQDTPKDSKDESKPSSKETKDESKPSSKETKTPVAASEPTTDTAASSSDTAPANSQPSTSSPSVISDQQAKEIAVAQVPGATIDNIREFEADRDDGRLTYEGSLHLNGVEYEFEIDGASGSIISWEIDD